MSRARRAERLLDGHVGLLEGGRGVAADQAEAMADVRARQRAHADRHGLLRGGRRLRVQQRRAGSDGLDGIEDRGQLGVGDVDERRGVPRRRARRAGDRRHDVARVPRHVGEHALVARLAAVEAEVGDVARHEHDAVAGHGGRVDAGHARVRVRRADERRVQHPRTLDVDRIRLGAGHPCIHADRAHPAGPASSSTARRTSTAVTRRR
jgi:hypothetical protein